MCLTFIIATINVGNIFDVLPILIWREERSFSQNLVSSQMLAKYDLAQEKLLAMTSIALFCWQLATVTSHSQPNRVSPSVRVNGLTKRGHGTANSPVSHYFICVLWPEQLIACLIQLWRRRRRFSSSGRRPRCCWRLGRGDDFETACHDPIILCAAS